jgi:uncharacterized protein YjiS (DUF1127 family)
MTVETIKANLSSLPPDVLTAWLRSGLQAWRRWRAQKAAVQELARLDDRALRDIGLERHELRAVLEATLLERERRSRRLDLPGLV